MNDKPMTIDDFILEAVHKGSMLQRGKTINTGMFPELKAHLEKLMAMERLKELDKVIELQGKQFNRWTQMDIANFFDAIGRRYRELTHQADGETK